MNNGALCRCKVRVHQHPSIISDNACMNSEMKFKCALEICAMPYQTALNQCNLSYGESGKSILRDLLVFELKN